MRKNIFILFMLLANLVYCQKDSVSQKRDIVGIRVNILQMINLGTEIFPAKHHALGAELQIRGAKNLKLGTAGNGVQRLYFDYRYYFSNKTGTSGLFLGTHLMYKKQHRTYQFSDPFRHGIELESLSDGLWGGASIGFRKRFPTKFFASAFIGFSSPLEVDFKYVQYGSNNRPKKDYPEARGGGEIGIFF